jgi:hypothetical protein
MVEVGIVYGQKAPVSTTPKPETTEHRYVRTAYESLKGQLEEGKNDYNEKMKKNNDYVTPDGRRLNCEVYESRIPHPAYQHFDSDAMDRYMSRDCWEATRISRFVMDKMADILTTVTTMLNHVDDCTKTYHQTIDKKTSDLTIRETTAVKTCQALDLYPLDMPAPAK